MADDGGILSFLDNNWSQLLGLPQSPNQLNAPAVPANVAMATQGYGGGMTPPPPAPSFSPSGAVDQPNMGALDPTSPDAQGAALGIPPSAVVPPPNYTGAPPQGGPMAGAPMPPAPGGPSSANAAPGMPPPPNGGMPPSPPPAPGYGPAGPSIPTSTGPVGSPMQIAPQAPPPPPPITGNGPQFSTMGSLAKALGISPGGSGTRMDNAVSAGLAGLSKGLSAVGNMKPGTPGLQAFAAGAGGGLSGVEETEKQKQQHFLNTSLAFHNMLAAQQSDNQTAYYHARSGYLDARAKQAATPGAGGSRAYQNDPFWKTMKVEDFARKYEGDQRQILLKQWAMNGTPPDEQQEDLKGLQKRVDSYRKGLLQTSGISEKDADKYKNMGTSSDNPFDVKSMSLDQFNTTVPMGAWFKDQNGTVRQRTVAPPESGQPQTGNQSSLEQADRIAMQEPTDSNAAIE